jgi:hypothetical protein
MPVPEFGNKPNFVEERLVVTLAIDIHQRNLQGDRDTLYAILGPPDLTASALAEQLLQPVLPQTPAALQLRLTNLSHAIHFGILTRYPSTSLYCEFYMNRRNVPRPFLPIFRSKSEYDKTSRSPVSVAEWVFVLTLHL